jgi:sugar lactone lactonase YvrE
MGLKAVSGVVEGNWLMQKEFFVRVLIVHLTLTGVAVMAERMPSPAINPKDYQSPSGEFVLNVDPTDMYGRDAGSYRMTRKGAFVWAGTKPFTLYDARITDEGIVAGYAYTHGVEGFFKQGGKVGAGEFHVVIMRPNGELVLNERVERQESRFLHTSPDPLAEGMVVDAANDRFAVRVRDNDLNRGHETWWIYRLSSGKAVSKLELATRPPVRAEPVVGTPLILLHYWQYKRPNSGARFALVDWSLREVWSLTWLKDYNVPGDEAAEDRLRDKIWADGAILNTLSSNQFTLLSAATSERVTYRVLLRLANSSQWAVQEVGRTKHIEPKPPNVELPTFPSQSLKQLGAFTLREDGPVTRSPIRDINGFDLDGQGRIGFIRREASDRYTFVHLAPDGKLLREIPLTIPAKLFTNDYPKAACLEGDRWIVAISDRSPGGKASAWWLDATSGKLTAISGFDSPAIKNIAGSRDGGFVALVVTHSKYTMESAMIAFDKTGKPRWQIKQDYNGGDKALFSPEDVTVTTGGRIAVLDNIRKTIQLFSTNGSFLTSLKLQNAWGRKPNYPTDITADKNGGVLVTDFQGSPPLVRMGASGKVLHQTAPKHRDGRAIDVVRGVRVTPSGHVWVCDGECFIRLGDDGVADLVLGNAPAEEKLGNIATLTVDQQGHLYAVDERTGAVHVYDDSGNRLRVCKPEVTDFKGKLVRAQVAAAPNGTVYLTDGDSWPNKVRFIHFAPDGKRLGVKQSGLDIGHEQWYPLRTREQILVLGYHDAFLVDGNGKVERTIQRRPNHKWLEDPRGASVAPDGSFAIMTDGRSWSEKPWQVNLYSSVGEPVRTVTMPSNCENSCFAFTGKYLATRSDSDICLFKATGEPLLKFSPALDEFKDATNHEWVCFSTRGGSELWFVSVDRKSVVRFELP